jgi:hypothetical protein
VVRGTLAWGASSTDRIMARSKQTLRAWVAVESMLQQAI